MVYEVNGTSHLSRMGTFKTQMLWDSIRKGDLTASITLLENRTINLEERDDNGQTFLMSACEFGELNIVRELLETGVDPNAVDNDNWTALLCASREGKLEIVIELLEKGAEIEHRDLCGWTALMWASYKGKDVVVNELLDRGANPNIKAELNMTCLAWAAGRGHTDCVKMLLQKGAKVNTPDKYGTTPLIWACRKGYLEIVEALLGEGADPEVVGMNSLTALLAAVKGGYTEVVEQLLEEDPNVNAVDKDGFTGLTIAAKEGFTEIANALLSKGAYVNLADRVGDTILIHAVKGGHTEVVRSLLNKYADVDVEGQENKTALYWAVEKGHNDIVKMLLEYDADLELVNKDGDSPLLRAVRNRNEHCVRMLLDKGAKVSTANKRGDTALHISLRARSKRITELLLRNPRNSRLLYRTNKAGETPYNIDAYHQKGILTHIFGNRNLNATDAENVLGYEIYSSALADILSEPSLNTPITVGLYAKWGSGKSFLLNKLQREMKSFTRESVDEYFTFCWSLFFILLLFNNIIGVVFALAIRWEVGLGVGLGMFPLEYAFLGLVYKCTHRFNLRFCKRISLMMGKKLKVLTLLLKVLFCNPSVSHSADTIPIVKFLFSEGTRLTSVGGEKALAAMIATLGESLEMEYGIIVARLFRVFRPTSDRSHGGRFKSICCIPYFVILIVVILCIGVGVTLLVTYGISNNTAADVAMGTFAGIVGLSLITNFYTWVKTILALLKSQRRRILNAAYQLNKLKMDGFMHKLKFEVNLMHQMVSCMDKFTRGKTRLVVIVDGLDSCEQDKVLQVLDIVNALFSDDNSPFITLLAVDPHIIIKGIESNLKNKNTFQDSNVNGFDYLRNVVHLPFYLQSQGLGIQKQNILKSTSTYDVHSHSGDSPSKVYRQQDSVMSASSVMEPAIRRKDTKRQRQDSVAQSIASNFDLTKTIAKNDYFSDVNPRSMRRLMNIVAVTGRLLRAYNIEFNWYRLASWINIIEQWPYRVSWIIIYFEENAVLDESKTLLSIYEKIADKIPMSKDIEPLLEIDRNARKLEAFLGTRVANNNNLNIGDLKKFLPCTINLDPYLRKLIRDMQKNADVLRQEFPMSMFPGSPSPAAGNTTGQLTGLRSVDQSLTPRKLGVRTAGYGVPSPLAMGGAVPHPMMPYGAMMMYPQGFMGVPYMPPYNPNFMQQQQFGGHEKTQDPSKFIQGYDGEKLSQMTVDDICVLITKIGGINPSFIRTYDACIRDNNINGLVLSNCDLDELGKVISMKFGDWQLFRSSIIALRQKEQDILQKEAEIAAQETEFDFLKTRQSEVSFAKSELDSDLSESLNSVHRVKQTDVPSSSVSESKTGYGTHKRTEQLQRQYSVESTKSDSYTPNNGSDKVFDTIREEDEPAYPRMRRNDSIVQQLQFEAGLLHDAMFSFTETPVEEEEGDELDLGARKQDFGHSKKLPVQFTLSSQHEYSPSRELDSEEYGQTDRQESIDDSKATLKEQQPLLEKPSFSSLGQKAVNLAKVFSGSLEKLSKPFHHNLSSFDDKSKSVEALNKSHEEVSEAMPAKGTSTDSTGFAMAGESASSRGSPFQSDYLQVVDEVDVHVSQSERSKSQTLEESIQEFMKSDSGHGRKNRTGDTEFVVHKTSPIQLVSFSDKHNNSKDPQEFV